MYKTFIRHLDQAKLANAVLMSMLHFWALSSKNAELTGFSVAGVVVVVVVATLEDVANANQNQIVVKRFNVIV